MIRSRHNQLNAKGSVNFPGFNPEAFRSFRRVARLSEEQFKEIFRGSPIKRAKWRGLLRNTLVAMGNSGNSSFRPILEKCATSGDELLAEHARWALKQLRAQN